MFELDIPGFGPVKLEHLVSDFTGTLSVDGKLLPRVRERLNRAAAHVRIHILTADTFDKARSELEGVHCEVYILAGENLDVQKEKYVRRLGAALSRSGTGRTTAGCSRQRRSVSP